MVEQSDSIPIASIYTAAIAVIEELEAANDIEELKLIFAKFVKSLALDSFQFAEITDPDNFPGPNLSFGTLSSEYIKKYWRGGNNLFHDPLIRQAMVSNKPVRVSQVSTSGEIKKTTQEVMKQRLKQGIHDGYTFPLKGRLNRFALVAIHGNVADLSPIDLASIEMACIGLYRRASDLHPLSSELGFHQQSMLTARERECLVWVAKGKTNWDISQILMITERTVQYHVDNACKKLGADTRLHAVVLASQQLEIIL